MPRVASLGKEQNFEHILNGQRFSTLAMLGKSLSQTKGKQGPDPLRRAKSFAEARHICLFL